MTVFLFLLEKMSALTAKAEKYLDPVRNIFLLGLRVNRMNAMEVEFDDPNIIEKLRDVREKIHCTYEHYQLKSFRHFELCCKIGQSYAGTKNSRALL